MSERPSRRPKAAIACLRPDDTSRLLWLLLPATLGPITGSLMLSIAYRHIELADGLAIRLYRDYEMGETIARGASGDPSLGWMLLIGGLIAIAAGPGLAIFGLRRMWSRDEAVIVHAEGLEHERFGQLEASHRWDDVARVSFRDETRRIVLELRDGEQVELDGKFGGPERAKELEDIRRKSSFGLLPQQRRAL